MAAVVRLPKLGANLVEATVGVWRKREGDPVRAQEPLVEMITSKATFEIESPADGILMKVLAPEKSNIPIGYALGIIGAAQEDLPDVAAENERLLAEFRAQAASRADGKGPSERPGAVKVRATPGARRLAREAGLDLSEIPMPPGRDVLREEDVREFLRQRRG